MKPSPRAPFSQWPVQEHDPAFGFFWCVDPATVVAQSVVSQFTVATAEAIHQRVDRVLAAKKLEVAREGGLTMIHDWRSLEGYDRDARQVFLDRTRGRGRGYLRRSYIAVRANPLLRMTMKTGAALVSVFLGATIDVVGDPALVVGELGLVPPAPGVAFPR